MTDPTASIVRLGVTGTDTGIGKTVVTCALAARARQLGRRVAAMKPMESGIDERPVSGGGPASDADRLRAACGNVHDLSLVRPYVLTEPLAPMVAAQRAGIALSFSRLDQARAQLEAGHDLLLVEGAGGLLVPITRDVSYATFFARWSCELIIVAGNRLGVLNHVLLTVQVAAQAGLTVRGVVLSTLSDREPSVAEATNFEVLQQLLPGRALYRFPRVERVDDADALAAAAAASGMDVLL
jgi:dethiobiotin synthetase